MKNKIINFILAPLLLFFTVAFIFFYSTLFPNNSILEVNKKIESTFFDDKKSENILIFFGYVGCIDICTPKLKEISNVYDKIKDNIDVKVYFINLTNSVSSQIADLFAKGFNKDFVGIQLPKKELEILKSDFDVFSSISLKNKEELDHTSFIFLVKKNKKDYTINKIFTSNRFDEDFIIKDILGL